MKVCMLKDVENVGMAGQLLKVSDGYGKNFLIPRKLAVEVSVKNEAMYAQQAKKATVATETLKSKMAMLAERIKNLHLVVKERIHDDGKLYGSVGPDEMVELLKEKDISINRKQVEFKKAIRSIGDHNVIIRLTSKLKPEFILKVTPLEK